MADTLFDDADDDFWIEDPYGEADDLAEHTMQSPVLVNWDPSIELEEDSTDWEYYSDDFWDEEAPKRKRRKVVEDDHEHARGTARKKRRVKAGKGIPELSLGEPAAGSDDEKSARAEQPVVWKNRGNSPKPPTVEAGMEEKVSILKDWRERFKPQPSKSKSKATSNDMSQQAVDEVIEQQLEEEEYDGEEYHAISAFYEDSEDGETLPLPAGPNLPHDVRSMLQNQLLNLSDLSNPDSHDQLENHNTPKIPPKNKTSKRNPSTSPDPAPEPISPPTPPPSKLPKAVDQAHPNPSQASQAPKQAPEASTQQNDPTCHNRTESHLPASHKRKHSASPEPQPEQALDDGSKRIKLSTHPNDTSAKEKSGDTPALRGGKMQKGVSRKRKTPPTNEEEQEQEPKRLKPESSGQDAPASVTGEKAAEATKAKNASAETKARSPAKKGNSKPEAAVPERRSTRRK
ncbi:MAG: hypothetical protein Q9194_006837 [Teloschistes cf. exilis]